MTSGQALIWWWSECIGIISNCLSLFLDISSCWPAFIVLRCPCKPPWPVPFNPHLPTWSSAPSAIIILLFLVLPVFSVCPMLSSTLSAYHVSVQNLDKKIRLLLKLNSNKRTKDNIIAIFRTLTCCPLLGKVYPCCVATAPPLLPILDFPLSTATAW